MGCYGIGVSRLLMAILEQHNDDQKVFWPETVAPFKVHIISLEKKEQKLIIKHELFIKNAYKNIEVLFDDRDERAGVKFSDADLMGIPYRIIFGKKVDEGIVELKKLADNTVTDVKIEDIDFTNFCKMKR